MPVAMSEPDSPARRQYSRGSRRTTGQKGLERAWVEAKSGEKTNSRGGCWARGKLCLSTINYTTNIRYCQYIYAILTDLGYRFVAPRLAVQGHQPLEFHKAGRQPHSLPSARSALISTCGMCAGFWSCARRRGSQCAGQSPDRIGLVVIARVLDYTDPVRLPF